LTYEECVEVMAAVDRDGDGKFNFSEFVQIMMYNTADTSIYQN
jgi:Ca2+-binding EF-hand superfamily protein